MTSVHRHRILFLCTANSCRSQMAEAMLRHVGGERFDALSAGSDPSGFIHPLAQQTMKRLNIPMDGQESKSWDDLAAEPIDAVVTLCDAAAGQVCPAFPGAPLQAHWSLPDPAGHPGSDDERMAFALSVAQRLRTKIEAMTELNWSGDRQELGRRLEFLGEI